MAIIAKLQAARDRVVAAAQAWRAQCQAWTAADGRTCDGCWYGYSTTDLKLRELCRALDAYDKARVMRLRGYGNSICIPVAVEFIEAYMAVMGSRK